MRPKWEKAHFFLVFHAQGREKRGCRERSSNFSLRSMELGWSSRIRTRLKVGVLIEGNAWTPNQEFLSEIRAESSGGCGFRAFGSSKSFVFVQRGREPSYSGLFSI